jgi:hypothetical protein
VKDRCAGEEAICESLMNEKKADFITRILLAAG